MIVNKYANGGGGSGSGVTPAQVQTLIDRSLAPYWDSAATESAIAEAVSGISVDATVLHAVDNTDGKFSNSLFNKGLNPGDVFTTYYQGTEEETVEEDWEGDGESIIMSGAEFRNFENDGTHVINNFNSNLSYAKKEEEEPKRQNKVADEVAENPFSNVEFWFGTSKKYGEGITYHLHYDKENEELVIDSEDEETEFVISQEKDNYIVSVVEDKTRDLFSIGNFGEEVDYFNPVTEKDETYIVSGYSVGAINMEVKIDDRSATKSAEPISYYFTKFNSSDYINGTRTFIPRDYDGVYVLKDEIKYDTAQLATSEDLDMSLSALRQEVYPRSDTYTKNEVNNLISAATSGNASDSAITQIQAVLSASGIVVKDPETSAESITDVIAIARKLQTDENVISIALNELHDDIAELSGSSVDLSAYWTSAETQDAIDEAISGFTPSANSHIIPAITTQAEYEAISGDVKTGDLIEVEGVDINGDGNPVSGLFGAYAEEVEEEGVMRKLISWGRRDSLDSVLWAEEDYPWMVDNDVHPIVLPRNSFFIAFDELAEDEEYNGIGFDIDGKPVITHIAQAFDDETGEFTGIIREDTPIGADMSAYYTSAQTEEAITSKNYVTSAQVETQIVSKNYITSAETANFVTSAQVETQIEAKNYVNSGDVKSQVEAYNYATVSQIPTVPTSNTAFTNDAGYITDAAIENLVTSAQVETQIVTKAAAYTPTSGFSTINGSAITNGGNIVIQGGADMSAYYTSAQTEEAISAATAGKADAANITGRNTGYYFPYYNEQGVITGDTQVYNATMTIHLSDSMTASANLFKDNNYEIPGIYVASKPGTAGQIAKSNGYGFTWANDDKVSSTSVSTIWKGTQAQYDAITTKNPNTCLL